LTLPQVVQNGRKCEVIIFKTREKGWGVKNGKKKIPMGSFIGIYSGEILLDDESELRGLWVCPKHRSQRVLIRR
jgi:[histone H3]-lysine9 N-trimethyltransferase SUV39H